MVWEIIHADDCSFLMNREQTAETKQRAVKRYIGNGSAIWLIG